MTRRKTTHVTKERKQGRFAGIRLFLSSLQIRYKFLLSFALIFFLSMLLCNLFIYVYVRHNIEDRIESELTNTTAMIYNLVNTSMNVAIKNHLRAVAEKNLDILTALYRKVSAGALSREDARKRAAEVILSQTIGASGYLYCLDSNGGVAVHPRAELIGTNVAEHAFVRQMMEKKQGYLEYEWKNPDEENLRAKALYMAHFEPWGWIIAVSAYRSEFIRLVNIQDFRQSILSLKFGQSGYAFVFDREGRAIIHPVLQDVNIFQTPELPDQYLKDMMQRKKGRSVYYWKNPGETRARKKLVMFNYIPEYQWIVASSSYLDELYQPLKTIRNVFIGISLLFFSIMLAVTFGISRTITTPLRQLMTRFSAATAGDYSARMQSRSGDEVGQLARYFNRFMDQLEATQQALERDITRSKILEKQVMQAGERERMNIGQALHDDLCPHLIGIAGLTAVIRKDLKSRQDPAADLAGKMGELMEDAVEKTRQLARGLCPVHLVSHGFQSALEEIADQFAYYSGIRFECRMDEGVDILEESCAIHLYHIAREAVNNAVKHAKCDRINIDLSRDGADGQIHLKVTDNGIGIDPEPSGRGIGLQIMAYRAKIIDAKFNIDTGPKGTQIHVSMVPVQK
ncbi:cache domain-containing protein [Desulfobacter postgatei]|uniref:cache domain-containing protein n=1 Tax=Desulfobacter postgatei TaxID=2293 RepID=UPI00259B5077|nr:cache domain-containing protein [uncultured Desulfobacter sp.]